MSAYYQFVRGSSWSNFPQPARVANRIRLTPDSRGYYLGLRLARSPVQRMAR